MVKMREKVQFPEKGVLMLPSLGGRVAVRCCKSCRAPWGGVGGRAGKEGGKEGWERVRLWVWRESEERRGHMKKCCWWVELDGPF